MKQNKKSYTKIALTLSICLLVLWGLMGTGTTIAWFTDTTDAEQNTFLIGELDLVVSHKLENGLYEEIDVDTKVFDDEALYEPGYVQVVYLKVENKGDVPFDYKLAVDVNSVNTAKSVLGNDIYLPNYLKYGVIFGDSEEALTREVAKLKSITDFPEIEESTSYPLNTYAQQDSVTLQPEQERFVALIVRMPEEVGNAANYRGVEVPTVELGITVKAVQEGAPL
ncbi:MAG: hypothetical protein IJZ53_03355 [Tyzzerella sp.]|nr:hypothetical protein [Tyzzerella sp.]